MKSEVYPPITTQLLSILTLKWALCERILRKVAAWAYHWDTIHKVELLWGIQLCGLINRQQWNFHSFSQNFTLAEHTWTQPVLRMQGKALWLCHESHSLMCRNLFSRVRVVEMASSTSLKNPTHFYIIRGSFPPNIFNLQLFSPNREGKWC